MRYINPTDRIGNQNIHHSSQKAKKPITKTISKNKQVIDILGIHTFKIEYEQSGKQGTITQIKVKDNKTEQQYIINGENVSTNIPGVSKHNLAHFLNHCDIWVDINPNKDRAVLRGILPGGGWGKAQHAGFEKVNRDKVLQFFSDDKGEGTYIWAKDMGFDNETAILLGEKCFSVDSGRTSSVTFFFLPSAVKWHYNINGGPDGSCNDSRIILAAENFVFAVESYMKGKHEKAYKFLGKGLHALQDSFAHTEKFVRCKKFGPIKIYQHVMGETNDESQKMRRADEADFVNNSMGSPLSKIVTDGRFSQRYSDTKTATYIYLGLFKAMTSDTTLSSIRLMTPYVTDSVPPEKAFEELPNDSFSNVIYDRVATSTSAKRFEGIVNLIEEKTAFYRSPEIMESQEKREEIKRFIKRLNNELIYPAPEPQAAFENVSEIGTIEEVRKYFEENLPSEEATTAMENFLKQKTELLSESTSSSSSFFSSSSSSVQPPDLSHGSIVPNNKQTLNEIYANALTKFKALHNTTQTCSISYEWEPEGSDYNKKSEQKNWIKRFARHLEQAGFIVTLDILDNMNSMLGVFVQDMKSKDKVFLIGTPLLKARTERSFMLISQDIIQWSKLDANFLYLILKEGEHSVSFPNDLLGNAFTDMRIDAEYPKQLMDMLAKVFGIDRFHHKYEEYHRIKEELVCQVKDFFYIRLYSNLNIFCNKESNQFQIRAAYDELLIISKYESRALNIILSFSRNRSMDYNSGRLIADLVIRIAGANIDSLDLKEFVSILNDKSAQEYLRRASAFSLRYANKNNLEVIEALVNFLKEKDLEELSRFVAVDALNEIGAATPKVVKALIAFLFEKNINQNYRSKAAEALGNIGHGDLEVINSLVAVINDKSEGSAIKKSAVEAVGKIGQANPEAVQALISVLKDIDGDIFLRDLAARALGKIGRAEPVLISCFTDLLKDKSLDINMRKTVEESLEKIKKKAPNSPKNISDNILRKNVQPPHRDNASTRKITSISNNNPSPTNINQSSSTHTQDKNLVPSIKNHTKTNFFEAQFNDKRVDFIEHHVGGGGTDCGFIALGIDRATAVQQLFENAHRKEIRAFVAPEIKSSILEDSFPIELQDEEYYKIKREFHLNQTSNDQLVREMNAKYKLSGKNIDELLPIIPENNPDHEVLNQSILEQFRVGDKLDIYCQSEKVFRGFIKIYYVGKGWLSFVRNSTSTLDALAELNRKKVYIWQKDRKNLKQLECIHKAVKSHYDQGVVHLLFTHGNSHYNLLEMVDRTPETARLGQSLSTDQQSSLISRSSANTASSSSSSSANISFSIGIDPKYQKRISQLSNVYEQYLNNFRKRLDEGNRFFQACEMRDSSFRIPSCFISYSWVNKTYEYLVDNQFKSDLRKLLGASKIVDDKFENKPGNIRPFKDHILNADLIAVLYTPNAMDQYNKYQIKQTSFMECFEDEPEKKALLSKKTYEMSVDLGLIDQKIDFLNWRDDMEAYIVEQLREKSMRKELERNRESIIKKYHQICSNYRKDISLISQILNELHLIEDEIIKRKPDKKSLFLFSFETNKKLEMIPFLQKLHPVYIGPDVCSVEEWEFVFGSDSRHRLELLETNRCLDIHSNLIFLSNWVKALLDKDEVKMALSAPEVAFFKGLRKRNYPIQLMRLVDNMKIEYSTINAEQIRIAQNEFIKDELQEIRQKEAVVRISPSISSYQTLETNIPQTNLPEFETLSRISQALKSQYQKNPFIERLNGELLPIQYSFVHVAIVKEEEQKQKNRDIQQKQEKDELGYQGLLQTYEDIHKPKQEIAFEKMFDRVEKSKGQFIDPKRILILGRAGIGKTTLCQKIAYEWSQGRLWNDKFDFVFWIKLRELNEDNFPGRGQVQEPYEIAEIIEALCLDHELDFTREELIKLHQQEKILYLLDGYDETSVLHTSFRIKQTLDKLLSQDCHTIITSRPYQTNSIQKDIALEILGFTDSDIEQYIEKIILKKPEQGGFKKFLQDNQQIKGQCHIPVQLDILSSLWSEEQLTNIQNPISITSLYEKMIDHMFSRYFKKKEESIDYISSNKRTEIEQESVRLLGSIAYKGMQQGKIIIDNKTIKSTSKESKLSFQQLYDIGLIKPIGIGPLNMRSCYFIHWTFQEYLAAKHIASLLEDEIRAHIVEYRYQPQYQEMLVFLAGIQSQTPDKAMHFFDSLNVDTPKNTENPTIFSGLRTGMLCLEEMCRKNSTLLETITQRYPIIAQMKNQIRASYEKNKLVSFSEEGIINMLRQTTYLMEKTDILNIYIIVLEDSSLDKDSRRSAASALGKIGKATPEVIQALVSVLNDTRDQYSRRSAADALGNIGNANPEVIQALVSFLNDTSVDPYSRSLAAYTLEKLGKTSAEVLSLLIDCLENADQANLDSFQMAEQVKKIENYKSEFIDFLKNKRVDSSIKIYSSYMLRSQGITKQEARTVLFDILKDNEIELDIRKYTVDVLRQLGLSISEVRTGLYDILKKPETESIIRECVLDNLLQLGWTVSEVKTELIDIMKDTKLSSEIRVSIIEALDNLRKHKADVVFMLIEVIKNLNDDLDVGTLAIKVLGNLGESDHKTITILIDILKNDTLSEYYRSYAATALGRLGNSNEQVHSELKATLEKVRVPIPTRIFVARALGKLGFKSKETNTLLVSFLENPNLDEYIKILVARALRELGDIDLQQAIKALDDFLKNSSLDKDIKKIVTDALYELRSKKEFRSRDTGVSTFTVNEEKPTPGFAPNLSHGEPTKNIEEQISAYKGIDQNASQSESKVPISDIFSAVKEDDTVKVEKYIKKHGSTMIDNSLNNLLHIAAEYGSIEIAGMLLAKEVSYNDRNHDFHTPLHIAAINQHYGVIKAILKRLPVDEMSLYVCETDSKERTALHYAAENGDFMSLAFMTKKAEDIGKTLNTLVDRNGQTILHLAAKSGNLDCVRLLVEDVGISWDANDKSGRNIIQIAIENDKEDIVDYIMNKIIERMDGAITGYDFYYRGYQFYQDSLFNMAIKCFKLAIGNSVKPLQDKSIKANLFFYWGNCLFQLMFWKEAEEQYKQAIEFDADCGAKDNLDAVQEYLSKVN